MPDIEEGRETDRQRQGHRQTHREAGRQTDIDKLQLNDINPSKAS